MNIKCNIRLIWGVVVFGCLNIKTVTFEEFFFGWDVNDQYCSTTTLAYKNKIFSGDMFCASIDSIEKTLNKGLYPMPKNCSLGGSSCIDHSQDQSLIRLCFDKQQKELPNLINPYYDQVRLCVKFVKEQITCCDVYVQNVGLQWSLLTDSRLNLNIFVRYTEPALELEGYYIKLVLVRLCELYRRFYGEVELDLPFNLHFEELYEDITARLQHCLLK